MFFFAIWMKAYLTCCIASRHSQTCSPVGCCCRIARAHEQITLFAWCLLFWQRSSRESMIGVCGGLSLILWISWRGSQKLSISDAPPQGFEILSWRALMEGARRPLRDLEEARLAVTRHHLESSGNSETRSCSQPSMMPSGPFSVPEWSGCK